MRVPEADAQPPLLPLIEDGGGDDDGSNLPNDDPNLGASLGSKSRRGVLLLLLQRATWEARTGGRRGLGGSGQSGGGRRRPWLESGSRWPARAAGGRRAAADGGRRGLGRSGQSGGGRRGPWMEGGAAAGAGSGRPASSSRWQSAGGQRLDGEARSSGRDCASRRWRATMHAAGLGLWAAAGDVELGTRVWTGGAVVV
jgi:hypothetical protein